jgi:ATP-dependent DNA helicase RecG
VAAPSSVRVRALTEALSRASADGFADIESDGHGPALREATDALLEDARIAPDLVPEFQHFRAGLERFESRGRIDRSRVVAHGQRLCMTLRADVSPEPSARRPRGPDLGRTAGEATSGARGQPTTSLPGIGPKTAAKLAERGLVTLEDLAYLLPLEYVDRRTVVTLDSLDEGQSGLLRATVSRFRQGWFRGRYSANGRVSTRTLEGEVAGDLEVRWFHRVGGLSERLVEGAEVLVAGTLKTYKGRATMVHPTIIAADDGPPGVVVRYPVVEGVGAATLMRACRTAMDRIMAAGEIVDPLPATLRERYGFPSAAEALGWLHAPDADISTDELEALCDRRSPAHRRLAFDEFFFLRLAQERQRAQWTSERSSFGAVPASAFDGERLRASIPFEPTAAQWNALAEIERDLGTGRPMLRLLQGDVGAGKTVVAFAAALAVIEAGGQAAIMAPTELLARQHARTLGPWCERAGVRVSVLTGSTPRAERASMLALLAAGRIDLLVGTHALITGDVSFASLGLVVVDEQHRFGVEQRARLRDKGGLPHLLVMTATPIPRSLALTVFGDLAVTVIDELPPGREPANTDVAYGKRGLTKARKQLLHRVQDEGGRAFVVVPLVEASEAVDATDVEATAESMAALAQQLGMELDVEMVHGRMRADDKDAAMERFRSGASAVLVATTVIEVGVDVPDANVMLIEHAERFGLAQLHQLRGRIGRGGGASWCCLHTASSKESDAATRLSVMARTTDGFEIAQADLELRGPGEVYGRRQSGVPKLRFAAFDAEGLEMLEAAREAAAELHERDPAFTEHPAVAQELQRRIGDRTVRSGEAG